MKRALLALAALLTIAPAAEAGRVCVVSNFERISGSNVPSAAIEAQVPAVLREYGVDFDVLPWTHPGLDTTAYRTGYVRDTLSKSGTNYVAFVHSAYWTSGVSVAAKRPNYMSLNSRWPLVPHVFVGANSHNAQIWHTGAGIDSTGNASVPAAASYNVYREYDAATGAGWSIGSGNGFFSDLDQTLNPKNVYRPILKVGASVVQQVIGSTSPAWKEQIAAPALYSATPDTCRLWVKYATSDYSPTWRAQAPCVFVEGPGYVGDVFPLIAALAIADSATGGQIFADASKIPQRASIVIGPWFSTGTYRDSLYRSGIFCRADSCDSANVHTTIDSLIALNIRGTVGIQVDSIAALAWQKPYLQKLLDTGRWKVSLQEWTGSYMTGGTGINARYHRPVDPLGTRRARTLIPPNATGLPCACPEADSSIYCLVKGSYAILDSVFPGKVDRTLTAPGGKAEGLRGWSRSITRANGRTLDSLMWVLYMAGVRAIETDPLDYGPLQDADGDGALLQAGGYYTVWDSGGTITGSGARYRRPLYRMPIVAIRGYEAGGALWSQIIGHQITEEFQWGRFGVPWYDVEGVGPFWNHQFQTRVHSFRVATSALGGSGQGTVPQRPGWWQIRKLKLQSDVINRLAGRQLWLWDWAQNTAEKSDLRK